MLLLIDLILNRRLILSIIGCGSLGYVLSHLIEGTHYNSTIFLTSLVIGIALGAYLEFTRKKNGEQDVDPNA